LNTSFISIAEVVAGSPPEGTGLTEQDQVLGPKNGAETRLSRRWVKGALNDSSVGVAVVGR